MSVPKNIYVGKRYIPKQCGLWDNTKNTAYESLSVVLYEGASFTSKQDVPQGIDINNSTYWVRSADYNAQVAIYEQNVRDYHQYVIDQIGVLNDSNTAFQNSVNESNTTFQNSVKADLKTIMYTVTKLMGEEDYTLALQRAIENCSNGGVIQIPQGEIIDFTEVTIPYNNITVTGNGILKGKIIINSNDYDINLKMVGLTFDSLFPLEIRKGRRILINNCTFKNCDKAIYINPPITSTLHSVGLVNIDTNYFQDVNYAIYCDHPGIDNDGIITPITQYSNGILICNDFHIKNNYINQCYITHFYFKSIDGVIIEGNTCFFPNYSLLNNTKKHNVHIEVWGDWIQIHNNNFFEAGLESILVGNISHINITGNNIAWCGQRVPSSAIKIDYRPDADDSIYKNLNGIICNNNISNSTKHGIELVHVNGVNISKNIFSILSANGSSYYGITDISTIEHYGVFLQSSLTLSNIIESDNISYSAIATNKRFNNEGDRNSKYVTISDNITTLEAIYNREFKISQTAICTISDITPKHEVMNGSIIHLVFTNGYTTIENNTNIILKNGLSFKFNNGDTLTLLYINGAWREISRTIYLVPKSHIDLNDTSTVIDLSNGYTQVNLIQPSATTITNVTAKENYQEITLIGYNGNTTLAYSTTMILKNGINVTIPSGGVIKLRYYSSKWYEVSRSF